jgi:hypothetical protein
MCCMRKMISGNLSDATVNDATVKLSGAVDLFGRA